VKQPGFISGETVLDIYNPQIFMTISTWASLAAWDSWEKNSDRLRVVNRINALLQDTPVVRLWRADAETPPAAI
jgi:quinol monooxygenase YgiN